MLPRWSINRSYYPASRQGRAGSSFASANEDAVRVPCLVMKGHNRRVDADKSAMGALKIPESSVILLSPVAISRLRDYNVTQRGGSCKTL